MQPSIIVSGLADNARNDTAFAPENTCCPFVTNDAVASVRITFPADAQGLPV